MLAITTHNAQTCQVHTTALCADSLRAQDFWQLAELIHWLSPSPMLDYNVFIPTLLDCVGIATLEPLCGKEEYNFLNKYNRAASTPKYTDAHGSALHVNGSRNVLPPFLLGSRKPPPPPHCQKT